MIAKLNKGGKSKNYAFAFLGNLFSAGSQWVVLMLLSKLYGTAAMGHYSLVMAWVLPLFAFFSFQIRNIHVSDQANVYGFDLFFKVRLFSALLFFLTICSIGYIFYREIFVLFIIGGGYKTFELMSDMAHAEFHKRTRIELYGKMLIFRSTLAIVLNFVMFSFIKSYQVALISLPIAYCISMLIDYRILLHKLGMRISFKVDRRKLNGFLVTGLMTGLSLLLVYMMPNIPRFVLEKFRSSFELGLFSGYMSLIIFTRIFVQALVQNSLPYMAQYYDSGQYGKFLALLKKEGLIITALAMAQFILIPISDYIFPLLFNHDFTGNKWLLSVIFAGSVFSFLGFVLNNGINAMKILKVQLPVYGVLAVISLVGCVLLVPAWGLMGAATVLLIVNVCMCAIMAGLIIIRLKNKINEQMMSPGDEAMFVKA